MDFLGHTVGVQLQANGAGFDPLGFWIVPVNDSSAIDCHAHAIALGENFDGVPVVLLANLAGWASVNRQSIAPEKIIHAVTGGEHDQVAGVGMFGTIGLGILAHGRAHLAPEADP